MKVAIFGSSYQKPDHIKKIFSSLEKYKAEIYVHNPFCEYANSVNKGICTGYKILDENDFDADIAISIGGDGTFLRTAAMIGIKDIPILGINAGRLGFLADVGVDEIEDTFSDIFSGDYDIEERSRLMVTTPDQRFNGSNLALNEIAILKQDTASMIKVHATINNEYLTSYQSDGLLISTPTGSTAYSLSVGGPILIPTTSCFVITAIAPHSLTSRPLVIEDSSKITLNIESRSQSYLLSLDGRASIFGTGVELTLKKAASNLKLIKRKESTFYQTLREKLQWGSDPRNRKL